jgi:hypothetical protein
MDPDPTKKDPDPTKKDPDEQDRITADLICSIMLGVQLILPAVVFTS